jgi:low affinity Fe/Cu permease
MGRIFTQFANSVAKVAGRPYVFLICAGLVILWGLSGPLFGYSDTWQLVINTSTTIITFLMVFLIQNTQNRDNAALQAKLDELIRVGDSENRFIGIEHLTDEELERILDDVEQYADELHAKLKVRAKGPKPAGARLRGKKPDG